jgi:hypothetical protein
MENLFLLSVTYVEGNKYICTYRLNKLCHVCCSHLTMSIECHCCVTYRIMSLSGEYIFFLIIRKERVGM